MKLRNASRQTLKTAVKRNASALRRVIPGASQIKKRRCVLDGLLKRILPHRPSAR
jgi:hypothetical protein